MDEHLLTTDDIGLLNKKGLFPPAVLSKVLRAGYTLNSRASHVIIREDYDNIYATSDIHADLRKLHYLLTKAGLISSNELNNIPDIMAGVALGGSITWLAPKTLFVIVGDIVDGSRDGSNIFDDTGNIEVLLHAYLYNLRIKARGVGSEIRFTIGNHDWHTVIKPYTALDNHLYTSYVHAAAKRFFSTGVKGTDYTNRRSWLMPFYNCCPYVFLSVGSEVAFVHGGLHLSDGSYSIQEIERYQKILDTSKTFYDVVREDIKKSYLSSEEDSPLWTRFYAENPKNVVCAAIENSVYKMIVVGHCQTEPGNFKHHDEILREPDYSTCAGGGLVLLGCKDAVACPRLAFVDIGMSCCFRDDKEWFTEAGRRAEFLHLQHDPKKSDVNRWYNVVKREVVSGGSGNGNSIVAWAEQAAAPVAIGGTCRPRSITTDKSRHKKRTKIKRTHRRCRSTNNY
jgi:hypothetical protein